jgi:hypothetical protein
MPRRAVVRSVFILSSIIVALLGGEVAARIAIAVVHKEPIVVSDARAGWAGRAGLHGVTRSTGGGTFRISTDAHGRRATYGPDESPEAGAPVILLIGDSFVQGFGVDDEQTFAWPLAHELPNNDVVDLGVLGYGTDAELIKLEEYLETNPDVTVSDIVVFVYLYDLVDVQRSYDPYLARSKPLFHTDGERLIRGDYTLSGWDRLMDVSRLFWILRSGWSRYFAPPKLPREGGVDVVVGCLRAMRELADREGIRLHVLAHRWLRTTRHPPFWAAFLDRAGAVDITEMLRAGPGPDPIGSDGVHSSAEGHRRVASFLLPTLQTAGPLRGGSRSHSLREGRAWAGDGGPVPAWSGRQVARRVRDTTAQAALRCVGDGNPGVASELGGNARPRAAPRCALANSPKRDCSLPKLRDVPR